MDFKLKICMQELGTTDMECDFSLYNEISGSIGRQVKVCIYSVSLLNLIAQFQFITKFRKRAIRLGDGGVCVRIFLGSDPILNLMRLLYHLVERINIRHRKLLTAAKSLTVKS